MKLSIGDAAQRLGVSVRTLHYYDEIGLLKPARISENQYRLYDDKALEKLQEIMDDYKKEGKSKYIEQKLKEIIINSNKNSDMKSLVTDIRSAIDVFSDGEERADDITILCFKINK